MPTRHDIQQTQHIFLTCTSPALSNPQEISRILLQFHPLAHLTKICFQTDILTHSLLKSALFVYKKQELRFGAGQGVKASCNMILWAKFHMHSSHWVPNMGNICFQIEHRMCFHCYWNRKGHELLNIIPLVRLASSTHVQWSEIISLDH